MKKIYIAGPYTGMEDKGVKMQIDASSQIIDAGHLPITPLLSHYIHVHHPKQYETWIKIDLQLILMCDYMFRIPMASNGADIEEKYAIENNIPVFYNLFELFEAIK